ncbi:MAG TPA: SDR family NAD(P)-dependent oxidoreductase [Ramlibacter sp.]|nr:SDR family NAD(P)-dependent oxidoreductase [Ramlibacter sp.]
MPKRLDNRICIVVGGGQTPGLTIGNGKATALRFAQEGATVVVADRNLDSASDTVQEIEAAGGTGLAVRTDVTDDASVQHLIASCVQRYGRLDVLHNNVGISSEGGDAPIDDITAEVFDRILAVNLRGMAMTCKYALEVMVRQGSGVIINVGSIASLNIHPTLAYKTSKAGVTALTQHIAVKYAKLGIRANCILPGSMATPMSVDGAARRKGLDRDELSAQRDARVPLRGKQGTGWDVANAALFLASDEANFITGANLPVDGGALAFVGT